MRAPPFRLAATGLGLLAGTIACAQTTAHLPGDRPGQTPAGQQAGTVLPPPLQLERFVVTPSHFDFNAGGVGPATLAQQDLETLPQIGADLFRPIGRSFGPILGSRLPAYHRLDLRASRAIGVKHGVLKVFVDVFNACDQRNLIAYDYTNSVSAGVLTTRKQPREPLPSSPASASAGKCEPRDRRHAA